MKDTMFVRQNELRGRKTEQVSSSWLLLLIAVLLTVGCAASSVEGRKSHNAAAYATLSDEHKALVDRGEIAEGMDTNAVLLALGPPSKVISQPAGGTEEVTWVYQGTYTQQVPNWSQRPTQYGYETFDFTPQPLSKGYTKAAVAFQNGRVVRWRNFDPATRK